MTVDKGQCLGIIGESGSGKSVTALSVMRLVSSPPGVITNGSIDFNGGDLLELSSEDLRAFRGKKISYVFQDPLSTLHPLYTVGQQLSEAIQSNSYVGKSEKNKKALELLKAVRISNPEKRLNSYPHELSGGMRQRIGIAMALANDPDIIIADEPTTALDVTVQAQILKLFQDLRREKGLALVFITHDLDEAVRVGHRIAIMRDGEVVQIGTPEEIVVNPSDEYVADFVKGISRLKVVQAKTIMQSIEEYKKTFGDNLSNNERVNENDILSKLIETSVSEDKPIIVTNNDNLEVGIITQSDLLKAVVEGNDSE